MYDAYDYVKLRGIALKESYPRKYSARQSNCEYNESTMKFFSNTGMVEKDVNTNYQLKKALQNGPIAIAMFASGLMSHYREGIMTGKFLFCSNPRAEVNHGIVLVGYGKVDPDVDRVLGRFCSEYWIIRNSWGGNWGEKGFFRLCMDQASIYEWGNCHVNKYGTWPNLSGEIIPPSDD